MLWAALLPDDTSADPSRRIEVLEGLATWGLQYSPRVAVLEACSVVMELEASARLFGGKRQLAEQVRLEAEQLGVPLVSWAPTSLAALALARAGLRNGFAKPLQETLDPLPLTTLSVVAAHEAILARLGCKTLGDVRALPRGGLSRRFDASLLAALDTAYGLRPDSHVWKILPDSFQAKLELMSRVEHAPAILFGARRLLLQMCGWLSARRCGVTAFTLKWCHDVMRSKTAGDGGELTIRTAQPTRDLEHLSRLLAEHLAKVELLAPVGDLELVATEVQAFQEISGSLMLDAERSGESLALVLERIAARLGPEKVLRPVLVEDHRLEWAVHWQPAPLPQPRQRPCPPHLPPPSDAASNLPQPTFLLLRPLKLASRDHRPLYQGLLHLLSGPHRVESGWWDRVTVQSSASAGKGDAASDENVQRTRLVVRDYWVALSEHAGVLWIYQTRLADDRTSWYLHGVFA